MVLPLSETGAYRERFGTRHRAALGITEQTDAVAVVVSEETGAISLVERGRIVRNLDEERLRAALIELLRAQHAAAAARASRHGQRAAPYAAVRPRARPPRAAPQAAADAGSLDAPLRRTHGGAAHAARHRAPPAADDGPSRVRRVADFLSATGR